MPTILEFSGRPHLVLPRMPGRYGAQSGYVYAIICYNGTVKIGSSVCPGKRIGEQCWSGYLWEGGHRGAKWTRVRRMILSGTHSKCRQLEKSLHRALASFRLGYPCNEKYRPSPTAMASLRRLFARPLSTNRVARFALRIYEETK